MSQLIQNKLASKSTKENICLSIFGLPGPHPTQIYDAKNSSLKVLENISRPTHNMLQSKDTDTEWESESVSNLLTNSPGRF